MTQKLTLTNPIKINGALRTELTHDALKITTEQFINASALAAASERAQRVSLKAMATDWTLHFYLGCYAIIAENPEIDVEDLKRLTGYDILNVADIGWLFTVRRSDATSDQNNSGEQSETTQKPSTPEQESSDDEA